MYVCMCVCVKRTHPAIESRGTPCLWRPFAIRTDASMACCDEGTRERERKREREREREREKERTGERERKREREREVSESSR